MFVEGLNLGELSDARLGHLIIAATQESQARSLPSGAKTLSSFRPGDKVSFISNAGKKIQGTVRRLGSKNVTVVNCHSAEGAPIPGTGFRVPPSLLTNESEVVELAKVLEEVPKISRDPKFDDVPSFKGVSAGSF
jgi:hypothetical protein